jgi:hypothetical protein
MKRICKQCGIEFGCGANQTGSFCSRDCQGLYLRSIPTHNIQGEKQCAVCQEIKPATEFHLVQKVNHTYLQGRCRACNADYMKAWYAKKRPAYRKTANRNRNLKRFGITIEAYDHILKNQGDGCAICGNKTTDSTGRLLSIDHDHDTGEVRGLLCHSCNVALGLFKEDPELLAEAIRYLCRLQTEVIS